MSSEDSGNGVCNTPAGRVICTRGSVIESVHRVHAAVVDWRGKMIAHVGDPDLVTFYRSAAKPFQALPLVEDGVVEALGLTSQELALCCASHNADQRHLEGTRSILEKAGLDEDDLECGPHLPMSRDNGSALLRSGKNPTAIHNNCSGKHAGMLALAVHHGWPTRGYMEADHPVQQRMLREVRRWSELSAEEIQVGIDGCGVVSFALPLSAMARSFGRFTKAVRDGNGPARIVEAMVQHPFMVAGDDRLCTKLMSVAGDRVFAKTGAEGVYCSGVLEGALGVAVKVEDGARRGSNATLVKILADLGVLSAEEVDALRDFGSPEVKNTLDQAVGEVRADFSLSPAGSSPSKFSLSQSSSSRSVQAELQEPAVARDS